MGVVTILDGVWDDGNEVCDWGEWRRCVSEVREAEEGYIVFGVIVLFEDDPDIMDVLLYKAESSWYDDVGEKECRGE
jgi:hypothetical protein